MGPNQNVSDIFLLEEISSVPSDEVRVYYKILEKLLSDGGINIVGQIKAGSLFIEEVGEIRTKKEFFYRVILDRFGVIDEKGFLTMFSLSCFKAQLPSIFFESEEVDVTIIQNKTAKAFSLYLNQKDNIRSHTKEILTERFSSGEVVVNIRLKTKSRFRQLDLPILDPAIGLKNLVGEFFNKKITIRDDLRPKSYLIPFMADRCLIPNEYISSQGLHDDNERKLRKIVSKLAGLRSFLIDLEHSSYLSLKELDYFRDLTRGMSP
jgi:hypothetical protein